MEGKHPSSYICSPFRCSKLHLASIPTAPSPPFSLQTRIADWDAMFEAQLGRAQRRAIMLRRGLGTGSSSSGGGGSSYAMSDMSETLPVADAMAIRKALASRRPMRPVFIPLQVWSSVHLPCPHCSCVLTMLRK